MRISLRKAWRKFRDQGDEEAISDHSFNELDEAEEEMRCLYDLQICGVEMYL